MRVLHNFSEHFFHPILFHGHDIKTWGKKHKPSKVVLGHTMLFMVQAIFSVHNLTGRYAMTFVSPAVYMAIRLLVAAPVMMSLAVAIDRKLILVKSVQDHARMAVIGVVGVAINPMCFMYGLKYSSASVAAVISPSQVVFIFIAAVLLRREKATLLKVVGVVIALGGVIVGMQPDKMTVSSIIGPLCILGSCLCNAVYYNIQGPLLKRVPPEIVMAWSFLYAMVPLTIAGFAVDFEGMQHVFDGSLSPVVLLCILFACFFVQIGGFNLLSFGIKYSGSPTIASAYSLTSPVMTIILSIIILGEPFIWMQAIGCAITIAGLVVLIVGRHQETQQHALEEKYAQLGSADDVELGVLLKSEGLSAKEANTGDGSPRLQSDAAVQTDVAGSSEHIAGQQCYCRCHADLVPGTGK